MDRALGIFASIWFVFIFVLNVLAVAGVMMAAPGWLEGWRRVTDIYSPFNLANFVVELISLAPGLLALWWRDRRRARIRPRE